MLRDLEELLHDVTDDGSRDLMAEAIRCYQAGTYRAAITMATAAAMDDLRRKLGELVASGVASIAPDIAKAHNHIEKLFHDQDPFERTLIDATERLDMFIPAEAEKLRMILKTRHLCAHPSGHRSSAEEARDCVSALIDIILSRPARMGIAAVTTLIERLKQPHFFPMIGDATRSSKIVGSEMELLVEGSHAALAAKLIDVIVVEAETTAKPLTPRQVFFSPHVSPARENCRAFACGMLLTGSGTRRAIWSRLERLIEKQETRDDALVILRADPTGLALLGENPLLRERAVALVRRNVTHSDARAITRMWREEKVLVQEELRDLLNSCEHEFIGRFGAKSDEARRELAWPELDALFFAQAIEESGTNQWDRANPAIDAIQSLSMEDAARVPDALRARYVFNVARYSIGTHANNSARALPVSGLGERTDFLPAFENLISSQPLEVRATQTDWEALTKIVRASAQPALLLKMLGLFVDPNDADWSNGLKLGRALEDHENKEIAEKAKALVEALKPRIQRPVFGV